MDTQLICPFCVRPVVHLKRHHLIPKSKGGKEVVDSCLACHRAIHALFSLKQLAVKYNTVEALMADQRFRQMVQWIAKQDPAKKLTIKRARDQQNRGKYR